MVRLCVVAPTVNVQVGGSGQAVSCKPHLPHQQLQSVIQTQVLPKFVSAFVQSEEAVAPDGSPLQVWLRRLAADMQHSIELHLQKQFAPSRPPSAVGLDSHRSDTSAAGDGGGAGAGAGVGMSTGVGSGASRRPPVHGAGMGVNNGGSGVSGGDPSSAFSSLADNRRPRSGRRRLPRSASTRASPIGFDGGGGGGGGGSGGGGDGGGPDGMYRPDTHAAARPSTAPPTKRGARRRKGSEEPRGGGAGGTTAGSSGRRPGSSRGPHKRATTAGAARGRGRGSVSSSGTASSDENAGGGDVVAKNAALGGVETGFMQSNGLTSFVRRSGRGSPNGGGGGHASGKPARGGHSKSASSLRAGLSYGRSLGR